MIASVRGVEGGRIVLDRRRCEYLPSTRRIEASHFLVCTGYPSFLAGSPEAPERSKRGIFPVVGPLPSIPDGFGVGQMHRYHLQANFWDICKAGERACSVIIARCVGNRRVRSIDAFVKGREHLGCLRGAQIKEATPDIG